MGRGPPRAGLPRLRSPPDVVLVHATVSPRHVRFRSDGLSLSVTDLGSEAGSSSTASGSRARSCVRRPARGRIDPARAEDARGRSAREILRGQERAAPFEEIMRGSWRGSVARPLAARARAADLPALVVRAGARRESGVLYSVTARGRSSAASRTRPARRGPEAVERRADRAERGVEPRELVDPPPSSVERERGPEADRDPAPERGRPDGQRARGLRRRRRSPGAGDGEARRRRRGRRRGMSPASPDGGDLAPVGARGRVRDRLAGSMANVLTRSSARSCDDEVLSASCRACGSGSSPTATW